MKNIILIIMAWYFLFICRTANAQGTWIQKASIPFTARYGSVGFSIGTKGYVGSGYNNGTNYGDFWEYNSSTNNWTQIASLSPRRAACAFSIGSKGYVSMGANSPSVPTLTDIWEYDPSNNTWVQKANFPGSPRYGMAGFAIGSKGYVCCGNEGSASGPYTNELWEFDPATNSWSQKQSFPGAPRYGLTHMGWSVNNKGYLGFGLASGSTLPSDFYEYDPATNSWTQKANFPLAGRSYGVAFASCNIKYYYAGTGQNGSAMSDIWKYDPNTDTWTQVTAFGGGIRWLMTSFVINGNGYCGTGYDFTNYYNDWWEYSCGENGIIEPSSDQNHTTLFPSAFSTFATLEIQTKINFSGTELRIFDITGRTCRKDKISSNSYTIYKGNLQQGVYFYDVINEGEKIGFGKFIIN